MCAVWYASQSSKVIFHLAGLGGRPGRLHQAPFTPSYAHFVCPWHPHTGISHPNRDSTCLNGPVKPRVAEYQSAQRMVDASSDGCAGPFVTTLEAWTEVVLRKYLEST